MAERADFILAPRCTVKYSGPSFPLYQGRRCNQIEGHQHLPTSHPLYSRRHAGGEGQERITWFDAAQKAAGEVGG